MNFSVCLIAKNEEQTLPRLLSSLKEFQARGGQVLLLDTGSTDKTVEVAKSLGCLVTEVGDKFIRVVDKDLADKVNQKFIVPGEEPVLKEGDRVFDYASARNYVAQLSPTDMIAMPDCDEVYTQLNLDEVSKAIDEGTEQLEYNFVFSHDEFGNEAIKFRHCKFYNRTKLRWVGIIHEVLQGNANRRFLDESIIKLEHYQNHSTDRSGYLRGLAIDCYENQDNDRNSHYFGRELVWTHRPQSAIKELMRHVDMNRWPAERAQSMIFIGDCYHRLGQDDEALVWYFKSFIAEPNRRAPLIKLAEHYYRADDPQRALIFAQSALLIPEHHFYANNHADYSYYPHEIIYWCLYQLGKKEDSLEHLLEAWHYAPLNPKYLNDVQWYDLPKVSIVIPTLGRIKGLQKCLDSIEKLNYPEGKIEVIVQEDSFENRLGVPLNLKRGVEKATGDMIVYASNDIEFEENSVLLAVMYSLYYKKRLVAFNTGEVLPDEGNICEHFLIDRSLIPEIGGEIFDTDFYHVGVDNLLWAKAKKLNEAARFEQAKITHHHFSKGGEMDEVYKMAWDSVRVQHDRELLKKKLNDLE